MRIVLVTHPCIENGKLLPYVPLGLLSLATTLEQKGYEVILYDLNSKYELFELLEYAPHELQSLRPDIIGLTSICNTYPLTIRLADKLKELNEKVPIILGGPQASATAISSMKIFPFIDMVICGEAECSFALLLLALKEKQSIKNISGLIYRENGVIKGTPAASPIKDINDIPLTNYNLLKNLCDFDVIPIESGRGCPFGCIHCSTTNYWFRSFRLYRHDRIIKQVKNLLNKGYSRFSFIHDIITLDTKWIFEFCKKISEEKLKFSWSCSSRIDKLNKRLLESMYLSGCDSIFLGIESGSSRIQDIIGKKIKLEDCIEQIHSIRNVGIKATVSFVTGYVEENEEDLKKTLDLILQLICSNLPPKQVQIHLLSPVSGSKVFDLYRNRLHFHKNGRPHYFSLPLTDDIMSLVINQPDIFPSFFIVDHPIYDRDFLEKLVLFSRALIFFPTTSFVFWKDRYLNLLKALFIKPDVLEPLNKVRAIEESVLWLKAVKECFLNIWSLFGNDRKWIIDLLTYEYTIHTVLLKDRNRENPMVIETTCDIEKLMKQIHGTSSWVYPKPPKKCPTTFLFWHENKKIKTARLNPILSQLLRLRSVAETS